MDKRFTILFGLMAIYFLFATLYQLSPLLQVNQVFIPPPRQDSTNRTIDHHYHRDQCKPHDQLVFIKTHKTGSTTLQLIAQMYGYYRNSSFLFNANDRGTGHIRYIKVDITKILPPLNVSQGDYDKYANQFDMSTIHFKYNRTFFNTVMKNDTKYITVLRDPVKQFESAFVFFGYAKKGNVSTEAWINKWFNGSKRGRFLNNNQMLDLGLPVKSFRNKSAVMLYIKKLSREFDLMLITEYFDESLLLLRKLMCWSFDDILYIKQNARTNASHSQSLSQQVKDKIRKRNFADTDLYEYFNQTLWKKIAAYGPSFRRDLQYFKKRQSALYNLCVGNTASQQIKQKNVARTTYSLTPNATDYCTLLVNKHRDVFKRLWKKSLVVKKPPQPIGKICHVFPSVHEHTNKTFPNQDTKWTENHFRNGTPISLRSKLCKGTHRNDNNRSPATTNSSSQSYENSGNGDDGGYDLMSNETYNNGSYFREQISDKVLNLDFNPAVDINSNATGTCNPKTSIVFIKTHKTGSSTAVSIFQRFGHHRNLLFALPRRNHVFQKQLFSRRFIQPWPVEFAKSHPYYDMLVNHAIYYRPELDRTVPNASYVTILRDPVSQLESAFGYFEMAKGMHLSKERNAFEIFINNPLHYYTTKKYNMKSGSKNGQLFDLGFDAKLFNDTDAIRAKIDAIDIEFDLVMITEYFDESLILLKNRLCWSFDDILYISKGIRSQSHRYNISDEMKNKIRRWNAGDVLLYNHFNETFWRKVKEYGSVFQVDLEKFRRLKIKVSDKCIDADKLDNSDRRVTRYKLNPKHLEKYCEDLLCRDVPYTKLLKQKMKIVSTQTKTKQKGNTTTASTNK
ncbi:uncharacterized protein [Amphiura filiformis]|uniref:uncharacterized protein n=1 Tax=Amphiura filiformis TaxID=82378 RepID=UPI003B216127